MHYFSCPSGAEIKDGQEVPFATGCWTPGSGIDGKTPTHGSLWWEGSNYAKANKCMMHRPRGEKHSVQTKFGHVICGRI